MPLVLYLSIYYQIQSHLDFLLEVYNFVFYVRSMTSFEICFVKGIQSASRFIILHINTQLLLHLLVKSLFFLHWFASSSFSKISCLSLCVSTFGLSFCSIDFILFPSTKCLDYCSFTIIEIN